MVVELFDADVAFEAVRGARRSVNEASCAEFYPQRMCLYRHYKDVLPVSCNSRQIALADGNRPLLLFLEILQHFRYDAGVPKPKHSHGHLPQHIQQHSSYKQRQGSPPATDRVIQRHDQPNEDLRPKILFRLWEQEVAAGIVVGVVRHFCNLVGFGVILGGRPALLLLLLALFLHLSAHMSQNY